jgi:hypothetical protein
MRELRMKDEMQEWRTGGRKAGDKEWRIADRNGRRNRGREAGKREASKEEGRKEWMQQ